ncbi:MAG: PAS domain S-box protein [Porticoccaceae bacterium]|jgi:PAS domain S-box-containing protein|nr:PAS domain S-box protein [Porticoccaceae bacterium]MBT3799200.1 PAS domain S-box protein [Porticoccaceae bacterium]MBT4163799.1 PAS domain S-box protein [Porticoccaceae bacterium]MBT4592562.1 PAS domain S-box protein [Porticoccaceae bacterium]MBT5003002.1 PAS domain S-box protein [Porticoccaceae bacterium]
MGNLYRQVVESVSEGILFADNDEIIRLWNKGAETIFGYTADEAIGSSLALIVPDRFLARHQRGYERVIDTGKTAYKSKMLCVPACHKDGRRISIEFSVNIILQESKVLGISAIIRDVTEKWHKEQEELKSAD